MLQDWPSSTPLEVLPTYGRLMFGIHPHTFTPDSVWSSPAISSSSLSLLDIDSTYDERTADSMKEEPKLYTRDGMESLKSRLIWDGGMLVTSGTMEAVRARGTAVVYSYFAGIL